MTKDELRQEIERLKAEVKRLEALLTVATLGNGRTNMLEVSRPSAESLEGARRIVSASGDYERDSAHDDCADQVAAELLRVADV